MKSDEKLKIPGGNSTSGVSFIAMKEATQHYASPSENKSVVGEAETHKEDFNRLLAEAARKRPQAS